MSRLTVDAVDKRRRTPWAEEAWLETIRNGAEHASFFESQATEYPRAATQGTWEEAFD